MKQMKIMTVALLLLFSMNSEATLSKTTSCNNNLIAGSLYQISFEPYRSDDAIGQLEFWMVFNNKGKMVPSKYWFGYDTYWSTRDVRLYTSKAKTKLVVATINSDKAKGCYATSYVSGKTTINNGNEYEFEIRGSGFVSRGNTGQFSQTNDADYFTLNNAYVDYGGIEAWGKMTFTQIR